MKKHPTKTQISKILNDCKFNPKLDGPLKVISDVGNTDYYMNRAVEFITEAKSLKRCGKSPSLRNAIALLALAVANEET